MKVKDLIEELQKHDGEAVVAFAYKLPFCGGRIIETDPRELPCLEHIQPYNKDGTAVDRKIVAIHIDSVANKIKEEIIDKQLAVLAERIIGLVRV